MKVAVITANLGNFDNPVDPVKQELSAKIQLTFHRFTDKDFPPRFNSMTSRLQARIVKIFGWQMMPGYDYYIWVDSSCALARPDSASWFLEQCEDVDIAVFKHPHRNTIQEEADYLKHRLSINCPYITPRYKNELIDEQLAEINADKSFEDQNLFASTAFVYKNNEHIRNLMKEWWYHTSRYHSIDQLSLPYVLAKSGCKFRIIPDNYLKVPYLKYVRK